MTSGTSIAGAEVILERSDHVRKISSLKETGKITEAGRYSLDVYYEGSGLLGSSSLRSLRMLFSYKATDDVAQHVEQKICENSPQGHHEFSVREGNPLKWSLEVKSGSLAKGLPVRVTIQRTQSTTEVSDVATDEVASPRIGGPPSGDSRLSIPTFSSPNDGSEETDSYDDEREADEELVVRHEEPPAAADPIALADDLTPDEAAETEFEDWTELEATAEEEEGRTAPRTDEEEEEEEEAEYLEENVEVAPAGSNAVWKEQAHLKRGHGAKRNTPLLTGFYRLILQKTDNLAGPKRTISCTITLTRQADGTLIKQHTREVGGFKAGRKLVVDFRVAAEDSPAVFSLQAETNARALIVPVKLAALIVYRGENEAVPVEALKSTTKRPLKRFAEKRSKATNLDQAQSIEVSKSDSNSKLLLEVKSVDVLGTKTWDLLLSEGFYYLGVVNVSETRSGGERKTVTGKLELRGQDDVNISEMESEPLPQDSLPWKAYFSVSSTQAPAKLRVSLKSHIRGIATGVRTSMKVKKVPDPYSYGEIKRKTEIIRHIAVAALGALLLLSYSMQLVQFVFSLCLPFIGISIRFICTAGALAYAFQHRVELEKFLREKIAEGQENLKWLLELDDGGHSIQKLKLLRERQQKKREEKRKRLEKLRQL